MVYMVKFDESLELKRRFMVTVITPTVECMLHSDSLPPSTAILKNRIPLRAVLKHMNKAIFSKVNHGVYSKPAAMLGLCKISDRKVNIHLSPTQNHEEELSSELGQLRKLYSNILMTCLHKSMAVW